MATLNLGRVVGSDGVSPVITVEEITGGHRVLITDAEGTKTFDVMDGGGGGGGDYVETDPTVPAWAKAESKPTYTAAEVGALPSDTEIPTKTSQLTNDSSFATQEYVGQKIAEAQIGGSDIDLSAYYTKSQTDAAIQTAVEEIELTPGPVGPAGADGKDGQDGTDGVSATHSWNGTVLTVTSASGTSSADLRGETGAAGRDGSNGSNGVDGEDGFSPVASVAQTDTGATITITDKTGTTSVAITNGKDGVDGSNGVDGSDGYTPVRGTDYYTDADKTEMVAAVIAALPVYNGEVS